jgi:hypothetical protein
MMNDELKISLLTCEPGTEVYAQYGHTALRCQNPSQGLDLVFNYGMFSFNAPNFVWRFVKGETDYQLGIAPYPYFQEEYASRGSSVYQQELNLTPAEAQRLYDLLMENYQPANRTYRYNFFYDNCTTRARDMVARAVDGIVTYTDGPDVGMTFRDIVHEATAHTPWTQFGIDLLLGAEADAPIGQSQRQFAPLHFMQDARTARIQRGQESAPLVKRETMAVQVDARAEAQTEPFVTPLMAALLYLIIYIGVFTYEVRHRRLLWWADLLLYLPQGLAGCVIALLFFFSTHPAVGSNWLILVFNPLPLLALPVMLKRTIKGRKDPLHRFLAVYLTIFMLFVPLIPQKFGVTVVILASILCLNSWMHLWVYRRAQISMNNKTN